ncbi:hypothetical protein CK203_040648 [Vitis vinifera]|uniref:Uncharacterized protein n=1 Tax=Vitis vinifera TaxID=29760 RepID=A0A438HIU8_VITVI|nr:hypothetical protein CK203_040648 [Vitis vinifera]
MWFLVVQSTLNGLYCIADLVESQQKNDCIGDLSWLNWERTILKVSKMRSFLLLATSTGVASAF